MATAEGKPPRRDLGGVAMADLVQRYGATLFFGTLVLTLVVMVGRPF